VPPLPNPPSRTPEEKAEAASIRVTNRPLSKYDVPIPDHNTLWGPIFADMVSQQGSCKFHTIGMAFEEELITYWKKNRSKYPKTSNKAGEATRAKEGGGAKESRGRKIEIHASSSALSI